ncbi:uncharacterized protein LOC127557687 [Antechinus flavipes]|uniref:uncharacterized protein LOC127557687 n=1 Tax=Antechinus flavipes TaxID=38775 RepID=UPI0022355A7C|nr:uncharacterized protein LOC127557687 [Antechinus flavipes]
MSPVPPSPPPHKRAPATPRFPAQGPWGDRGPSDGELRAEHLRQADSITGPPWLWILLPRHKAQGTSLPSIEHGDIVVPCPLPSLGHSAPWPPDANPPHSESSAAREGAPGLEPAISCPIGPPRGPDPLPAFVTGSLELCTPTGLRTTPASLVPAPEAVAPFTPSPQVPLALPLRDSAPLGLVPPPFPGDPQSRSSWPCPLHPPPKLKKHTGRDNLMAPFIVPNSPSPNFAWDGQISTAAPEEEGEGEPPME